MLDLLIDTVVSNEIVPTEIDAIRAWGEGHVERASWLTKDVNDAVDAQFSIAHGLSIGAHRFPPTKTWQDPDVVLNDGVQDLMNKVTYERHPDWVDAMVNDPSARPSRTNRSLFIPWAVALGERTLTATGTFSCW